MPELAIFTLTGWQAYVHHYTDAAGDMDFDLCDADKFLKKLDWFTRMEAKEWQNPSTPETGSAK